MAFDVSKLDAILADVVGGVAIRVALKAHGVNSRDFYAACDADADIAKRYARAKAGAVEAMADEILELQDAQPGTMETQFGVKVDPGWVQHQRNRVEARKWLLAKLAPKKYGERTVIAGDADNPIAIVDAKAELLRGLAPKLAGSGTPETGGGADQ